MKNYIAPKSTLVSMDLNENIAASTGKTVTAYNMQLWVVDGMVQEIESLKNNGTRNYLTILFDWVVEVTKQEMDYQRLLEPCRVK